MARPRTTTPAEPAAAQTAADQDAFQTATTGEGAQVEIITAPPLIDAAVRAFDDETARLEPVSVTAVPPEIEKAIRDVAYQTGYDDGFAAASAKPLPLFEEAKRLVGTLTNMSEQDVRDALRDLQNTRAETLSQADLDLILVTWRRAHQAAANRAPAAPKPTRAAGTPRSEQEIREATTYETVR